MLRYVLPVMLALPLVARSADKVDFRKDVRPILAEHCFACHGPDDSSRKGKLRLDTRNNALAKARSGAAAIVPGKLMESELMQRITSQDENEVMPPPKHGKPLNAKQIATFKQWIEQGALYDAGHWAFTLPVKAAPPGSGHPIDAFVQARLKREGLAPSPAAAPETLLRRVYLDVIGLPPTPKQIDDFLADHAKDRPAAIRRVVDQLLASPRYGEKWARHWLDVARYSDSNGYEKDLPREMWAYRDWVIRTLNRDLPYDQFLIEQLAGDLLPNRTQDQLIATGFLRNSMINEEGAIVPEQFRTDEMFDRMDALGKAAFGLTFQCAQCHTHKYDPLKHTEYYGLYAFLNDTYEAQSSVYTADQLQKMDSVRQRLTAVETRLKQQRPTWAKELATWEEQVRSRQTNWQVLKAIELHSTSGLNHPTLEPDDSILTLGHPTTRGDIFAVFSGEWKGITALRLEALTHGDLPFNGPGRSKYGTWAISELEITAMKPGGKTWDKLKLTEATADWSEPEHKLEEEWSAGFDAQKKRTVGPVSNLIDGKDDTAWRADRGPGRRNAPSVAVVKFEKPLDLPAGTKLKVLLKMFHSGDDNGRHNTMLGRMRISTTTTANTKAEPIDYAAILAMQVPAAKRNAEQRAALFNAWWQAVPDWKSVQPEVDTIWKDWPNAATSVLHLAARSPEHPRATKLLDRGSWDKPKDAILPHTPEVLHKLPDGPEPPRLRFARWVADKNSPLVARVAVNRTWQALFGTGLVETAEDFGTRAPLPDHPEVLDWLAVDFMQQGWSQKQMLKTILLSDTYQQSSKTSAILKENDPANRLLARGPRFRADAEVVRDLALSAAGLLHVDSAGGPSVFPPVPESVLEYNYTKPTYWKVPSGPDRYKRSIYVFRKRSMPDPTLTTLDAPNGDFSCARRVRSNTPLAALVTLNEPIFVEASRGLAIRVLREAGPMEAERMTYSFRLCTGRRPNAAELAELEKLLDSRKARLAEGWLNPREVLTGQPGQLPTLPAGVSPTEAAAWTLLARVLLNLDETLTKN